MVRTIGIGVIGMGWMGQVHSRGYRLVPDRFHESGIASRLIVCADNVEARARRGKEQFGFDRHVTDWREAIDDPRVEAVAICAPNAMHVELACAAAEAGKHTFCEKPVGMNPQQTAKIARAARRAGVLSGVGYNYRWAPLVQYARQLITEGKLGRITHYRGRFLIGYASNPHGVLSWRFDRAQSGMGTLGDLMSHVIDMAHMMVGPIARVVSQQETFIRKRPLATPGEGTHFSVSKGGPMGDVTNEDYVGALSRFACGARGTLEACRVIQGSKCGMAFEIHGTGGALRWDFERMNELKLYLPQEDGTRDGYVLMQAGPEHPYFVHFNPGPAVSMSYEDLKLIEDYLFLKSIADGRQGQVGFTEALAVAEVQDAMQRSWASETWETVGPVDGES
ncbi:MAG: oxidoreductase [Phycisphaeraceae bacterium]|nr:oxidoreductase [Phycisphaeraceae bacterium]